MDSSTDISQLCRLCLLKDKVNTPIFEGQGDIGHVYKKISSLLPVKVAEDDKLPKSICDSCTLKLDMFYEFWQMSGQSEKKLLEWLNETEPNNINQPTETIVKQEAIDINDKLEVFMNVPTYGQDFFEETTTTVDEPQAKRPKRATAAKASATLHETDDEDDPSETLTKMEDESEGTEGEDQESAIVNVPSTSADSQPGPSGVGKESSEAPFPNLLECKIEIVDDEFPNVKELSANTWITANSTTFIRKRKYQIKVWTCAKCLLEFRSRRLLSEHTRNEHPSKENDEQYTIDTENDSYICNNCSKPFNSLEEIQNHIKTHEEQFICDICSEILPNMFKFASHLKDHNPDGMYSCPVCTYTTSKSSCLKAHINRIHYQKFTYNCKKCGKGFNDPLTFKEHDNEHLGIKPFVCVVCKKSFMFSRNMILHQVRIHTVHIEGILHQNQCKKCFKVFGKLETLKKHLHKKHNGEAKKNLCDMCGREFNSREKLKMHYRIHTGDKPYACQYCEKRFTKRDYVVMHERIHTGDKPYKCEHCNKRFNQMASLRIHVRGHTGERPYICNFCKGGFISRGSLNLHMKICNGFVE